MSKSRIKFQEITDWRFDHFPYWWGAGRGRGAIIVSQNKVKGIENLKREKNKKKTDMLRKV